MTNSPLVAPAEGHPVSGDRPLNRVRSAGLDARPNSRFPGRAGAGGQTERPQGPRDVAHEFLGCPTSEIFSAPQKACTCCAQRKPADLDNFPPDARKACGLRGECRVCFATKRVTAYAAKRAAAGFPYQPRVERYGRTKVGRYKPQDPAAERSKHKAAERASPGRMLVRTMRKRIARALGPDRESHYSLGCTPDQLRAHIERQFVSGMSWQNRNEWHVDHIRPLASFDLTDPEQLRAASHFTNLRPLWAADNLRKGARLEILL